MSYTVISGRIDRTIVQRRIPDRQGFVPILVSGIPAERARSAHPSSCGYDARSDRAGKPHNCTQPSTNPLDNKLLASLPRNDFEALRSHLAAISLMQGDIVYEAGAEVDYVYFPHGGMFSLLAVMRDGKAIETATVGREGVVGAMAGLGLYQSLVRVMVQLPLHASKIAAAPFRRAVAASDALRDVCVRYNEVMLTQARVTAACNALHQIEERFLPLVAAIGRSRRERYRCIDAGTAGRNARRPQDVRHRCCAQDAGQGHHHI